MLSSELNTNRLIQAARSGEPGVLDQLLEAYRDYLRLMARSSLGRCLRGKADASDLVQETVIRAHRHFHQFRGHSEAELAAWLRAMRDLFARLEGDTRCPFPSHLVEKARRAAARVAERLEAEPPAVASPTTARAAVESLEALAAWCDRAASGPITTAP